MADLVTLLNTIWENASAEYQNRVPQATRSNLSEVGNPLIEYTALANEFLDALVNRIGMTIVNSKIARNPLSILKKGSMPLGQDVQDIFVNMAKGKQYDVDSNDLLTNVKPDVKAAYYRLNRQNKYSVTITEELFRQAFTSYDSLNNLINGIVNSLYSGDNRDEFILMKQLVTSAVSRGLVKCIKVTQPADEATGKAFIKTLRINSSLMKFPSSNFNQYMQYAKAQGVEDNKPVETWTPIENQVVVVTAATLETVGVDVLAAAFHMEKADFMQRIVEVDQFDDEGKILCLVCDEAFFQVWDNMQTMRSFDNTENLTRKYTLHKWQTLAVSPFANAVCFLTRDVLPITIDCDDVSMTVGDDDITLEPEFYPDTGATDKSVSYVSSSDAVATVSSAGVVHAVGAGTATITITSTATYPTGATPPSKQITVTVASA